MDTITPGASNDNGTGLTGTNSSNGNIWDEIKRSHAGDGISDYNHTKTKQYFGNQRPNTSDDLENTNGGTDFHSKKKETGIHNITQDLPENFDRTEMTLQIETDSIGVIYKEEI